MSKLKLKLLDKSLTTCQVSGNTIMYRDTPAGHLFPPPLTTSKYEFEWDWNVSNSEDLVFYTDFFIQSPNPSHLRKVAWLIEPPCKQPHNYNWISKNNRLYDYVLTFDETLLARGENFVFYPYGGCWIESENRTTEHKKSKCVSIITSGKKKVLGHLIRHDLIKKFGSQIDVMGMGYNPISAISTGLKEYMFHIAMENESRNFYFTEKIINPIMTGTVPIYYGMPSIGKYFDVRGMILFNTVDEVGEILNGLSESKYKELLPYVKENFKVAQKYILAEDYFLPIIINKLNHEHKLHRNKKTRFITFN